MFQYFGTYDRIVVGSIGSSVESIAEEKQLRTSAPTRCVLNSYLAEVEPAIRACLLEQDHFRQEAVAATDFED